MASLTDNLGRKIEENMPLDQLKALVKSLANSKVGPAKAVKQSDEKREGILKELQGILEKNVKDFSEELNAQREFFEKVVDNFRTVTNLKEKASNERKQKKDGKETKQDKTVADSLLSMNRAFTKKGSGYTHDEGVHVRLNRIAKILTQSLRVQSRRAKAENVPIMGGGGGGNNNRGNAFSRLSGGGGGGGGDEGRIYSNRGIFKLTQEELQEAFFLENIFREIEKFSDKIQKNFMGFDAFHVIFNGILKDEREFLQQIRATTYEVEGLTKESAVLESVYEKIGKSVSETGIDRVQTQKHYLKAFKTGIRDQNKALSITKSQLNTETQIGVEAGSLHDTFVSLARVGKMNSIQIGQMGRGIRDVARNTGVTGEALAEAVKASQQFTKNLTKAAQLSATAATNIVEIVANAQKFGIADEMQDLLGAMTSTNKLLFNSSKGTQSLLYMAAGSVGKMNELINGTILKSKAGIKSMGQGFDNILRGFGVDGVKAIDNLSDEAKTRLNLQLNAAFGLELGDFQRLIETMQESGKGMSERLDEINKQQNLNLTTEEKAALQEKKRGLFASKSMEMLTALDEAAKGTEDGIAGQAQTLEKFSKRLQKDFSEDIAAMGEQKMLTPGAGTGQLIGETINNALSQINAGRKKYNMEEVKIDAKDIQAAALGNKDVNKMIMNRLQTAEQELATKAKAEKDPITSMSLSLMEINENIKQFTQSIFIKTFNSVMGQLIVIAGVLGSIVAGIGLQSVPFIEFFTLFGKRFGKISDDIGWFFSKRSLRAGGGASARPAGLGNFAASKKLNLLEKANARLAPIFNDIAKYISSTADNIAKSIRRFGRKAAIRPVETYVNLVEKSWSKTYGIAKDGTLFVSEKISKMVGSVSQSIKVFKNRLPTLFAGFIEHAKDLPRLVSTGFSALPRLISTGFSALPRLFSTGWKMSARGITTGISALTRSAGKLGASLFKLAAGTNPVGWAITAVLAAGEGLYESFKAASRAGEIFNKSQEDVTLTEEYSAKSAGFLMGALNALSFGLLGLFLPMDKMTNALARFNAKVPILTAILSPVIVILEAVAGVIWGVVLLVWEALKGLWTGIMNIINPAIEGITNVFNAFAKAFGFTEGKASGLTKIFRDLGGVFGIVSNTFKYIGIAIGWIFRAIGGIVGYITSALFAILEGFMVVFEPFGQVFGEVGKAFGEMGSAIWDALSSIGSAIYEAFKPIYEVFKPVIDLFGGSEGSGFLDTMKMLGTVLGRIVGFFVTVLLQPLLIFAKYISFVAKNIQAVIKIFQGDFSGAFDLIKQGLWDLGAAIVRPFTWLYDVLVGHSIVPDLINGIFDWFSKLPGKIFKSLLKLPFMIGKLLFKGLSFLGGMIWKGIKTVLWTNFVEIPSLIIDALSGIGGALSYMFLNIPSMLSKKFKKATSFVAEKIYDWIVKPFIDLKNTLFGIGDYLYSGLTGALGKAWDWFTGYSQTKKILETNVEQEKVAKAQDQQFKDISQKILDTGDAEQQKEYLAKLESRKKALEFNVSESEKNLSSFWNNGYNPLSWDMVSGSNTTAQKALEMDKTSLASTVAEIEKYKQAMNPVENKVEATLPDNIQAETEHQEITAASTEKLTEEATKKGSIYTHDVYCEKLLGMIYSQVSGGGLMPNISNLITNEPVAKIMSNAGSGLSDMLGVNDFVANNPDMAAGIGNMLSGIFGWGDTTGEIKHQPSVIAEPISTSLPSVEQEIAQRNIESQPQVTEVISSDLGELAGETSEQTLLLEEMRDILQKFLDLAKPKSSINSAGGGSTALSRAQKQAYNPPNYWRSPIGHVEQTPARAVSNVGVRNI